MAASKAPTRELDDEKVELAADEGHDERERTLSRKEKELEVDVDFGQQYGHDIEKDAVISTSPRESSNISVSPPDEEENQEPEDPNVVFWDGPNDPANPMNWSSSKKWGSIAVVSAITFLSPLGSSMIAPGVPGIMSEFHSDNELLSGFVVSVYVLGFAFGPLVIAPMSEMWGRLPLYHSCQILFLLFTLGCALSKSMGTLIGLRFLAGSVGASPLTLGGGTIADLIPREKRGMAMAMWVLGPTLGPTIGPVAGGFISGYLGWRWNFWILTMLSGASSIMGFILQRETYAPVILARKAKRLRKETGNDALRSKLDKGLSARDLFFFSIVRPSKMLLFSPIVQAISTFVAIEYAYLYMLFTTFTSVFEEQYHFAPTLVGLAFLGLGVGQICGQLVYTFYGDRLPKRHMAAGTFKPEHRLPMMIPAAFCLPIALFIYAWTVQAKVFWIVPIIATGIFGFGLLLSFMPANTYLVDVYTVHAASAMAANTVLRSVLAAVLPLAGPTMYRRLGLGWGNSLLAFIAVAMLPIPFVFVKYGEQIRKREKVRL
ncbi:MFS general substrate transporter [Rhizodiscina lignyota]|uniref:MFS general substrate transporter n=1 Tax=Rhizodiscina lignyota TaxID=1504668 RepID=A0A9P4IGS2_9PEZI|nr:MFS general substrate transporter [Rhizodiscina lignyota]